MSAEALLAEFRPGLRVYVQGAVGEPLPLRRLLQGAPEALEGVEITGCFLPGINDFDYAALSPSARLTTFMLPGAMRASFEAGRVAVRPLAYSQIAAAFDTEAPFDLAILQLAPADAQGLCSFGPCADFGPIVAPRARRCAAFLNRRWPALARGPALPLSAIDIAIDREAPFITAEETAPSPALAAIAETVAGLVPDGAAIQSGIGGAPAAAVGALRRRRDLTIRSGLVSAGYKALAEAGALAPGAAHIAGMALGEEALVGWAARTIAFADARQTHGPAALGAIGRFCAINSALEVDLFGQANAEWRGGSLVGGIGGASDFARAARASEGGKAILALPATAGARSRIVARLAAPTVSLARNDVDVVVTEHGAAELRGLDLEGRAQALIAIAAPAHRPGLEAAWTDIRRGL
ncbi:MAG TPA: acetyl-CoA hydrolase/transferase C-terminal domain-containing protein [Caulobacteraceae bacterium]|nr:acetyl-CoA hydrolase/transferase C-terminal domain-containing protein [Caulobacteraceae bacterium]